MMFRSSLLITAAALALCWQQPAQVVAQSSSVKLEESTGNDSRPPSDDVINIKIGTKKQNSGVQVLEPGEAPDPDEVKPAPKELPVSGQNEPPLPEATAIVTEEDQKPVEAMEDVSTTATAVAVEATTATTNAPVVTSVPAATEADTKAAIAAAIAAGEPAKDEVGYLPAADLSGDAFVMRGDEKIAMRPEDLVSSAAAITVPDVYSTTLTTGLHFYHYESHDLPRVRVSLIIQAGQYFDPADKVGLADLSIRTMRSGGAAGKSGDEIDEQLEQIGSDLEFNVDRDYVSGSMFALTDKTDEAMALLADVLLKPDFDEKKFEQEKARALEGLRRQNDEPGAISRREFRKIVYGADSPLARTPTSASISSITRDDVRAFHDARVRPSTLWVGLSGDITQEAARALVEKTFGEWDRPAAEAASAITVDEAADTTGGVYFTPKATAQSQIRLGHLGIGRHSPQVYAVNVLNSIYGMGGFSSRLMNQVRTKHGYVYGVGGGIFSDEPVGLFAAVAASKGASTGAAINEILDVTKSVIEGPISEDELETARRDILYTFVNQFDTPAETLNTHMLYDYRGYAPDYLKNFPEHIREVTGEDVKRAAKELMHPDHLKIYVIGNEGQLDMPLSTFGDVKAWELESYVE